MKQVFRMPIRKKIKNSKSQAHEVQTKSGKQPILQKTFYSWRQQMSAWPGKGHAQMLQENLFFFFFAWRVVMPQFFTQLKQDLFPKERT